MEGWRGGTSIGIRKSVSEEGECVALRFSERPKTGVSCRSGYTRLESSISPVDD